MDPAVLPAKVVDRICSFLPVKDLLTCSLVNSVWRDAINKNSIWKRRCILPMRYENIPCKVKPEFQAPTNDCENLSPLCRYRIHYMRQIHVQNNVRHYHCYSSNFPLEVVGLNRKRPDEIHFFDKYMVLGDHRKNIFHMCNIEEDPIRVQSIPYLLNQTRPQAFQIIGDIILIVQCNLLQLFQIENDIVTLKLRRIFNENEKFSEMIPSNDTISSWYDSNINLNPSKFTSHNVVVGNYFIGIVELPNLNESTMHIWDLNTGTKLKEDKLPPMETRIYKIVCGKNSKFLYLALYTNASSSHCYIFSYSLSTLKYTQFCAEVEHSIHSILGGAKIIVLACEHENFQRYERVFLMFLDALTGNIVKKEIEKRINPECLDLNKSLLLYCGFIRETYSNVVTILDLNTLTEVASAKYSRGFTGAHLLDNNWILYGCWIGEDDEDSIHCVELEEIKSNRMNHISEWEKNYMLRCGGSISRLATLTGSSIYIRIYHYW